MLSVTSTKSSNAIKTADEYIKVGDKAAAIQCLYDSLDPTRNKMWVSSMEDAINKLLDICIDIRESESAKEALTQYRNICQQHSPTSMTVVVDRFLDACKKKIEDVQEEYNLKDSFHLHLEEEVSADTIFSLLTMGENDPKRIEHEVIYPWVRFYWDNLRGILDLIKTNNTMEDLYHSVCKRAFDFCKTYNRVSEFSTLRRSLHKHLDFLMNPSQDQTNNRFRVTWCSKTAELQLNTRFAQLEVACALQLWSEAFNILTDIRVITNMAGGRIQIQSVYYQKLSDIFWEFHNYLYHAFAQMKLLSLQRKQNKSLSEEEVQSMSSQALLAALCIPMYSVADDETHPNFRIEREKEQSINCLFGVSSHISREIVHNEIASLELLSSVPTELATLYTVLEKEFHPLDMMQRVQPCLEWIEKQDSLKQYLTPLRELILLRVLKQMETVFSVMKLQNYEQLIQDLHFDRYNAEHIIMEAGANNEIHIRIDYAKQCIYFKPHIAEKDVIASSISILAKNLFNVMINHNPDNSAIVELEEELDDLVENAREKEEIMHEAMLDRFRRIEESKTKRERAEHDRSLSEQERMKRESEEREEKERIRLREEEERRIAEQIAREKKQREEEEFKNHAATLRTLLGKKYDAAFVESMTLSELKAYVDITTAKVEKERQQRVARDSERQLFLARAYRENAIPFMDEFFNKKHQEVVEYWDENFNMLYNKKKDLIMKNESLKPVCERLSPYLGTFTTNVLTRRALTVQEVVEQRYQEAEAKRKAEEARKAEEERLRREEEERKRREEEERRRVEEERRRAEEERKRKEEEELRRVEELRKAEEARKAEERRRVMMADSDSDEDMPTRTVHRRAAPKEQPKEQPRREAPRPKMADDDDEWRAVGRRSAPKPKMADDDDEWRTVGRRSAPKPKMADDDDGWTTVEKRSAPKPKEADDGWTTVEKKPMRRRVPNRN